MQCNVTTLLAPTECARSRKTCATHFSLLQSLYTQPLTLFDSMRTLFGSRTVAACVVWTQLSTNLWPQPTLDTDLELQPSTLVILYYMQFSMYNKWNKHFSFHFIHYSSASFSLLYPPLSQLFTHLRAKYIALSNIH